MADLKISVDIDASGTAAGAAQAKAAIKGIGDEAERTQRRASSILDIDFRAAAAKLQSVGEMVGNAGQRMQQAGQSMSVAVNAIQTAKPPQRSQGLKNHMARKASDRAALIRAARERALGMRGYGGRFGGLK